MFSRQTVCWLIGLFVALAVILAIHIGTALLSLSGLLAAVRDGDGAAVLARTDRPALAASISRQVVDTYMHHVGERRRLSPAEQMIASAVGGGVVQSVLQQLLTPENLTLLLQRGHVAATQNTPAVDNLRPALTLAGKNPLALLGRLRFVTPVGISIRISEKNDPDNYTALHLHSEGLTWKLSGIDLPQRALRDLASAIPAR